MRRFFAVAAISVAAVLAIASSASAFEGGGRKPSEAPLITVGQHYTGQLNNHKDDANYGGNQVVAIWRLPPVTTRDVIAVDWHSVPYTERPGEFPICMIFAQGIDDFNWGGVFGDTRSHNHCYENGPIYELSGSGTARSLITVQETNVNSSYLEFYADAQYESPSDFETFAYDFTVQPPLHYLGLAITPVKRVSASGILRATANLASGLPAPDGLTFSLAVTWTGGGSASYTGVSSGGVVSFQLALPETAYGNQAAFVVSHPADASYQGVTSPKAEAKVAKPKPPGPTPCSIAESRALTLKRQFKRLQRHARQSRGPARVALHRRATHVKRKLRAARAKAASACAIP
jgi:hypothetical protein